MHDLDFIRGTTIRYGAVTQAGSITFDTMTVAEAQATEIYKSNVRTPSDWYPSLNTDGNALVMTDTDILKEVTFKGLEIHVAAAVTFGTPKVIVTDEADNIYFEGNLVSGLNHFDFADGLRCQKPGASGAELYGDFSVELISPPAGTHSVTITGWKI